MTVDVQASMARVIEDMETHQRNIGTFAGHLTGVAQAVQHLDHAMGVRFDQVDRRFEQVDQRFMALEKNLETRFGVVDDQLRRIDARIEQLVGYIVRDELKGDLAGGEALT